MPSSSATFASTAGEVLKRELRARLAPAAHAPRTGEPALAPVQG